MIRGFTFIFCSSLFTLLPPLSAALSLQMDGKAGILLEGGPTAQWALEGSGVAVHQRQVLPQSGPQGKGRPTSRQGTLVQGPPFVPVHHLVTGEIISAGEGGEAQGALVVVVVGGDLLPLLSCKIAALKRTEFGMLLWAWLLL